MKRRIVFIPFQSQTPKIFGQAQMHSEKNSNLRTSRVQYPEATPKLALIVSFCP